MMNIKSFLDITYNTYYYNFFKKDPCESCLVQPCCLEICENKQTWNLYTDEGRNKSGFQMFNLIMIIYGIIVILYYVLKLIE